VLEKVLLAVVVLVVTLCAVIATRPDTFKIERTATIAAPAMVAFGQVNDFHKWNAWSPWEGAWSPWGGRDPQLKRSYEGSASGMGAKYGWVGNDDVGEGKMEITESKPGELVRIKLDFIKPMEATHLTTFSFKSAGEQTSVTWSLEGKHNFMGKAFSMVMDMDQMVGKDFEKGLASMSTVAQAEAAKLKVEEAAAKPPENEVPPAPPPILAP
jgi:hypothetical protein